MGAAIIGVLRAGGVCSQRVDQSAWEGQNTASCEWISEAPSRGRKRYWQGRKQRGREAAGGREGEVEGTQDEDVSI